MIKKAKEKSILFVDGNPTRKKQTSSRIRMQGFKVELAQDGFHAIHLIEKRLFDLVIIQGDELHDMPAMEISGLLRNTYDRESLPILAILSHNNGEEAQALTESGVNEVITDNGNFNLILQGVKKLLN